MVPLASTDLGPEHAIDVIGREYWCFVIDCHEGHEGAFLILSETRTIREVVIGLAAAAPPCLDGAQFALKPFTQEERRIIAQKHPDD